MFYRKYINYKKTTTELFLLYCKTSISTILKVTFHILIPPYPLYIDDFFLCQLYLKQEKMQDNYKILITK